MKRNFESWLLTMKDSIATWNYYTDFPKVYENVNKLKVELNILNSLIGSKNIEDEFKALLSRYPEIIKAIPILWRKEKGNQSHRLKGDLCLQFCQDELHR